MKKIILALLFSNIVFSQTMEERKKIASFSDKEKIADLKSRLESEYQTFIEKKKKYVFDNGLSASKADALQRFFGDEPIFFTNDNFTSSTTIRTNTMYPGGSLGLNVTGQNITAGVWDQGRAKISHIEFTTGGNRVTIGDGGTGADGQHSTHVSGTICAAGVDSNARGIAYQSRVVASDWDSDATEMMNFAIDGGLMSNHSYGYAVTQSFSQWRFGSYDAASIEMDELAYIFPYYQIVVSAGNLRNDTNLTQVQQFNGYDLLTGKACAKNVLTVAAVNNVANYVSPSSVVMSSFSCYGPTDDGRVKPDISAKGVGVYSTNHIGSNGYATLNGTSMSSPAITGMLVMLQKHYNNKFPSNFMRSATARGLICHSAREAGAFPGPDYEFGWGLADAESAARIITNSGASSIIQETELANGTVFTRTVSNPNTQNLTFTICWTDPKGIANSSGVTNQRAPRLINNLDLVVTKDGTTYYPWKLNPDVPTAGATNNSDNNVDNIEKIEIPNAEPGVYTIRVSHKNTLQNSLPQEFTLIASSTNGLTLDNTKFTMDNSFFVYPNPAKNILNYTVSNGLTADKVTITDLSGKQLNLTVDTISNSVDVSSLQSGIYFMNFKSNDTVVVKKFVKN